MPKLRSISATQIPGAANMCTVLVAIRALLGRSGGIQMSRRLSMSAALCAVGNAAFAQGIGSADVITSDVREEIVSCIQDTASHSALSCFNRSGVTAGARGLARSILEDTDFGMVAILESFHEAGEIDVAEVLFPTMANTNYQMVLVNGVDGPQMAAELNFRRNLPRESSTMEILEQYPRAFESGRVNVVAVRPLPGGGQRFVLTDVVTDGCRGCEPVALSLRYFDYANGQQIGFQEIGWQPLSDVSGATVAERLRAADVRTIQQGLNALGYNAGPVDGAAGQQTMAAFMAFKRDYCLSEDNRIGADFIEFFTNGEPGYPVPPCATNSGTAPELPFPDGIYVADDRLCPPVSLEVQAEFGDRAYVLVISVSDGSWSWGENICDIRATTPSGSGLVLDLDCESEGTPQQTRVDLEAVNATRFEYRGRFFSQC